MKILVIGGTGHVSRLVDELHARGVEVRVLARQRPRPGTLRGKVEGGDRRPDGSPAIEAAFKAVENMFLLNAVNAPADAGLVAYGLARRAGIGRVIYFSIFRVKEFATFRISPPRWEWKAHCGIVACRLPSSARLTGSRTRYAPGRGVRQRHPPLVPAAAQELQRSQSECRVGDRITP